MSDLMFLLLLLFPYLCPLTLELYWQHSCEEQK